MLLQCKFYINNVFRAEVLRQIGYSLVSDGERVVCIRCIRRCITDTLWRGDNTRVNLPVFFACMSADRGLCCAIHPCKGTLGYPLFKLSAYFLPLCRC